MLKTDNQSSNSVQFITYRDVSKVDTFLKQSSQKFLSRLGLVPEIKIFFPPLHMCTLEYRINGGGGENNQGVGNSAV